MSKKSEFANRIQGIIQAAGQLWPGREKAMKKTAKHLVPNFGTLVILGLFLLAQTVGANPVGAPQSQGPSATMISYQGRLTDADGVPLSGDYQMRFALYDVPTGGSPCWSETQTVSVSDGLFNVLLGSTNSIDHSCLTGDVYLGIKVGDDFEMTPRELLTSVPYAVHAGIQDGAVTTAKLADGAVTTAKLNLVDGNVGIGTADPGEKLVVARTDFAGFNPANVAAELISNKHSFLKLTPGGAGMDSWGIFAGGDNDRLGIYSYGGQAERVSVLESGNVGIGTTSPDSKLHIVGGNVPLLVKGTWSVPANAVGIRLCNVNDEAVFDVWQDGEVNIQGNVGIGTREPGAKLSIADGGATAGTPLLKVGDDSFLTDVDVQNTLGIYGNQDSTTASIRLGSNGGTISGNNGNIVIRESLHIEGPDLCISHAPRGDGGRALVHDAGDTLTINYDHDFAGGVKINGPVTCDALVEANLQTKKELDAGRIDRFQKGDVLCWGMDQLELCSTPNDRLVQAIAGSRGRPIVIGAEVINVLGPVRRGDLLVASGVPGYAMTNNDPAPGTVIAQALEDFEGEKGIIKAMIRKF